MDVVQRFADLVVRAGVNVQPGQEVVLVADAAHIATARAVVESAYAAGAAWVETIFFDGPIRRSAVDHATVEHLTESRPWALEQIRAWIDRRAALIQLGGEPYPHVMDDADPVRAASVRAAETMQLREAMLSGHMRWTGVAVPNPGWATQVFGGPDLDRLWAAVATAMRLDEDDPVARWRDRSATLAARATALEALELTEVRYLGEGTDLTVGLIPGCRWAGGGTADPDGGG